MSKTAIWSVVVIVVLAIAGGLLWWNMNQGQSAVQTSNNAAPAATTAENTPSVASTSSNGNPSQSEAVALPSGNSDQAINQELTDINTQMNGLNSDSASVNQSENDQPVQQTQL